MLQLSGLCFLISTYQILLGATLSTAFSNQPLYSLLLPINFASAIAIGIFYFFRKFFESEKNLKNLGLLLCALVPLTIAAVNFVLNKYYFVQLKILVMALVALPYIVFGIFLSAQFYFQDASRIQKIIFYEMAGIALGVLFSANLLVYFGFSGTLAFSLLVAGLFLLEKKRHHYFVALICLVILVGLQEQVRLAPDLHAVARNSSPLNQISETRRSWTTYALVQTLEIKNELGEVFKHVAIGGSAHAYFPSDYDYPFVTADVASAFQPKSALILFAGAGHELKRLNDKNPLQLGIGVEVNSQVVKHGMLDSDSQLQKMLSNEKLHLVVDDARRYLERSQDKFDLVLYSWSGATMAHYSGAIMHTTQYAFTTEALKKAYSLLTENGKLIIFGGSKVNVLLSLQALGIDDLPHKVIELECIDKPNWTQGWDDNILIVSKSNFETGAAEEKLISNLNLASTKYKVAVINGKSLNDNFDIHAKIINEKDPEIATKIIAAEFKLKFDAFDDDRPFVYKVSGANADLLNYFPNLNFIAAILFLSILIYAYYCVKRRVSVANTSHVALLFIVGLSTLAMQVLAIYRFALFAGDPTTAFTACLFAVGTAYCLATLFYSKFKNRMTLIRTAIIASVVIWILFLVGLDSGDIKQFLFVAPTAIAVLVLVLFFTASIFGSALIFVYVLSESQLTSAHRLWMVGFECLGGALAVSQTPILVEEFGIRKVFYLSLIFIIGQISLFIFKTSDR